MAEVAGVLAAVLSSALGGSSVGATRYLAKAIDPLAIGSFRFGIGVLLLVPLAMLQGHRLPARHEWPAIAGLGLLFFAIFPVLFNVSLIFTTAARGALALSTLPLLTMLVGAALGSEPLSVRKSVGVLVAIAGVSIALLSGLGGAPDGAWRGDLVMVGAALCMAFYSVWSKPHIRRCGPIVFTTFAMAAGAAVLLVLSGLHGSFAPVANFSAAEWLSALFLGTFGSALTFYLWAFALERTTPTRVAISVTVNPVAAALVGATLLGEPLSWSLSAGIVTVFVGIWIATMDRRTDAGVRCLRK